MIRAESTASVEAFLCHIVAPPIPLGLANHGARPLEALCNASPDDAAPDRLITLLVHYRNISPRPARISLD
ncbi:MAG: hypothetical protein MK165_00975 [Pirellulaceae bacterium]|nr:hypothetical protein [Pirellulaceae bacterium]